MEVIDAKKSGISGGASTPPEAIHEAMAKIKTSHQLQYLSEKRVQCQS
jgi:4-hydroxy-3-methylbut-2-enyl diphosphate reductase